MNPRAVEQMVLEEAEGIAASLGFEVVDVELQTGPRGRVLCIYIDKQGGVTVEDCRAMSDPLSRALDRLDPIPGPYRLEVSSPGIERPLRRPADFERFAGHEVEVHLYGPLNGRRHWTGRLLGLQGGAVRLETGNGETTELPLEQVSKARLRARWQGAFSR